MLFNNSSFICPEATILFSVKREFNLRKLSAVNAFDVSCGEFFLPKPALLGIFNNSNFTLNFYNFTDVCLLLIDFLFVKRRGSKASSPKININVVDKIRMKSVLLKNHADFH